MSSWFTLSDLAERQLPGLPRSLRGLHRLAERERWTRQEWRYPDNPAGRWRRRSGQGGGTEFSADVLPERARAALETLAEVSESAPGALSQASAPVETAPADSSDEDSATLWRRFECLTDARKDEARRRLALLDEIEALIAAGTAVGAAVDVVAHTHGIGPSTLWEYRRRAAGGDAADRLPRLADHRAGRAAPETCDAEAWEVFKADYLRLERPTLRSCYRRLESMAEAHSWTIPSARTLERRLNRDVSAAVIVLAREGATALKRLYPAQQRDHSVFHALEAVNADGHQWDVWVQWPAADGGKGEIARPCMVAWQDILSGKILAHRIDRSENKESVRLAFGDVVEGYGIPDHVFMDNGRAFAAKWLTGGTATRYRFKVRDEDPVGLFPALGCQVHWATPYAGQSKPIERAFRDFCDDIAKSPHLAGAWTGNTPLAKPENYRSRAIPLAMFEQVVRKGIAMHNARRGRRAAVCNGRSFDQVFEESYAQSPIRKATAEQRRLWLLAAEGVRADSQSGSLRLMGNRYWGEFLSQHMGQPLTVRFDPQDLHRGLHVYRIDGAYLGEAACIEAVGFADQAGAQAHGRARRTWMKAQRAQLEAERTLSIDDVARMLPVPEPEPEAPTTKVVRPLFRGPAELPADDDDVMENFARGVAKLASARKG